MYSTAMIVNVSEGEPVPLRWPNDLRSNLDGEYVLQDCPLLLLCVHCTATGRKIRQFRTCSETGGPH